MDYVLAIDAGTTGVRAMAFGSRGAVVAAAYQEFPQHFPRPGWVEHDIEEIYDAVVSVCRLALTELDGPPLAIGITNQRETAAAWDRQSGRPLHRAIVWQDRRTAPECATLAEAGHLPLIRRRTGLVLDPYFSATKWAWMLGSGGVGTGANLALGTLDSYLVWRLSGGSAHVTDPSNASRTLLYDIHDGVFSEELCELFAIPRSALPDVVASSGRMAETAGESGLPPGIPISGLAGDQQAALFGQACVEVGMAKNTYGTGSFVLMNTGSSAPEPPAGLLTTVAWALDDPNELTYALEGAVFVTGASVQWLRDGLAIIESADEVEALAASIDSNDGVYLVPAFAGLGSPWWDPDARGTVVGLTRGTGRAHLARAALEAIAYQVRDVVEVMADVSGQALSALRVDGGASTNNLLLQLQADQIQIPVQRPIVQETTALGAALLAGRAEGLWPDLAAVADCWQLDTEVTPSATPTRANRDHAQWRRAVERSRAWA